MNAPFERFVNRRTDCHISHHDRLKGFRAGRSLPGGDTRPITWCVEAYDDDGGVDVIIFSGNDAKERAIKYAAYQEDATRGFE